MQLGAVNGAAFFSLPFTFAHHLDAGAIHHGKQAGLVDITSLVTCAALCRQFAAWNLERASPNLPPSGHCVTPVAGQPEAKRTLDAQTR